MKQLCATAVLVAFGTLAAPALAQEPAATPKLTIDQAVAIALARQPGTVAEAELDQFEGRPVADIEIVNESGEEIEFKIDLQTGEILNVWTDDYPSDDPDFATLDDVTFLIPGDLGGGWDAAARAFGDAFTSAGLAEDLKFENRAGDNGGIGLTYMIENGDVLPDTLFLNTTHIVTRSLNATYEKSYNDLVPVAAPIADFVAFVVHSASPIQSMADLLAAYENETTDFAIGGGSAPNGLDHLVAAMVIKAADEDPTFSYVQFEAPEPAFAALVAGDVDAVATEYTRALALSEQGAVRIIGVTAPENYPLPTGISKMHDQDIDLDFVTWTGLFAAPSTSEEVIEAYDAAFAALYQTDAWAKAVVENGWLEVRADAELFAEHLNEQHEMIEAILERLTDQ